MSSKTFSIDLTLEVHHETHNLYTAIAGPSKSPSRHLRDWLGRFFVCARDPIFDISLDGLVRLN